MHHKLLLAFGVAIVIAGVVVSIIVFPTRYGRSDGAGTFTTSASVAEASCGSPATRFVAESSVVADQRLVPRGLIAAEPTEVGPRRVYRRGLTTAVRLMRNFLRNNAETLGATHGYSAAHRMSASTL